MKVIAFFVICSLAAFAGITPGNADNVRRAGDTMSGNLDMGTNSLLNIYRATITGPTNTYAVTIFRYAISMGGVLPRYMNYILDRYIKLRSYNNNTNNSPSPEVV